MSSGDRLGLPMAAGRRDARADGGGLGHPAGGGPELAEQGRPVDRKPRRGCPLEVGEPQNKGVVTRRGPPC